MNYLKQAILVLIVMICFCSVQAEAYQHNINKNNKNVNLVVVYKSSKKMYLFSNGRIEHAYNIELGYNPEGPKHKKGDGKTPVGHYVLNWRNPNSKYYRSIHISYPNAQDVAYARQHGWNPGGDIMIHGQPNNSKKKVKKWNWTLGCIALSDKHMKQVWNSVKRGTPIDIYP